MSAKSDKGKGFDVDGLVTQALGVLKHWRLSVMLIALTSLAAVGFYMFSRPMYSSRALLDVQWFGYALHEDSSTEGVRVRPVSIQRNLLTELRSEHLLVRTLARMEKVKDTASPESVSDDVVPKIRIFSLDPDTIQVSLFSYDPEVVRGFYDAFLEEYDAYQDELRQSYAQEAREKFADEVVTLEKKVESVVSERSALVRELETLRATLNPGGASLLPEQIAEVKMQLRNMDKAKAVIAASENMPAIELLALLSGVDDDRFSRVGQIRTSNGATDPTNVNRAQTPSSIIVLPEMVENREVWVEWERELRELKQKKERLLEDYLPGHQRVQEVSDQIENFERKLAKEVEIARERLAVEFKRAQERIVALEQKMPEYNTASDRAAVLTKKIEILDQSQETWDRAIADMKRRADVLEFGEGKQRLQLGLRGILSIRDDEPVSPNKMKLLMAGLALGFALAVGVPIGINRFDTSLERLDQAEDLTGLEGIGVVPLASRGQLEAVRSSERLGAKVSDILLECFRMMRSNIMVRTADREDGQVIAISSSKQSEGKTTVAANLAWAYWSAGEKVLLVDADLRRGRVHEMLELDNSEGLNSILTGELGVGTTDRGVPTSLEGFDAVVRGETLAGATEILCSDEFRKQLDVWRKNYDRIILDCPPLLGVSDTVRLQNYADGMVFVTRAGVTKSRDVKAAIEVADRGRCNLYGVVLNSLDLSKLSNYYYYSYYAADDK